MSFVTSSSPFPPVLGILLFVLPIVVIAAIIGAVIAGRTGERRSTGPAAYFLFGLSLLTLTVGVSTTGVTVHAISQLVGPDPQNFSNFPNSLYSGACPAIPPATPAPTTAPTTVAISPASTTTEPTTTPGPLPTTTPGPESAGVCGNVIGLGNLYDTGGPPPNNAFLTAPGDDSNHYISIAVAAGLFTIAALVGYRMTWRRARKLSMNTPLGSPPVGRLPLSYAYLVAGLAAVAMLVFVPVAADNIFRAIAPGVNETSGHADGLRNLVTFLTLSALTSAILLYHLRFAASIRDTSLASREAGETGPSPGATPAENY